MILEKTHSIILIDDECVLCNRLIRLIADADHQDQFRITGLQTEYGKYLLKRFQKSVTEPETLILIEANEVYEASDAVLRIAGSLRKYRWIGKCISAVPFSVRDRFYYFIAKRRYILFGKSRYCSLDPKQLKKNIREKVIL